MKIKNKLSKAVNTKHGKFIVGEVVDVSDDIGERLISQLPHVFEKVAEKKKKKLDTPDNKMMGESEKTKSKSKTKRKKKSADKK